MPTQTHPWLRAELIAAPETAPGAQLMIPADGVEFHDDQLVFHHQGEVVYVAHQGQLRSITWFAKQPNPETARRKAQWPNHGTRWTDEERADLLRHLRAGHSWKTISHAHGRSRTGCQQEAIKQGWLNPDTLLPTPELLRSMDRKNDAAAAEAGIDTDASKVTAPNPSADSDPITSPNADPTAGPGTNPDPSPDPSPGTGPGTGSGTDRTATTTAPPAAPSPTSPTTVSPPAISDSPPKSEPSSTATVQRTVADYTRLTPVAAPIIGEATPTSAAPPSQVADLAIPVSPPPPGTDPSPSDLLTPDIAMSQPDRPRIPPRIPRQRSNPAAEVQPISTPDDDPPQDSAQDPGPTTTTEQGPGSRFLSRAQSSLARATLGAYMTPPRGPSGAASGAT